MNRNFLILLLSFFIASSGYGQDLMNMLGKDSTSSEARSIETFRSNHIILGQSVETIDKGNLNFMISHHFDKLSSGSYNFFGLDMSTIRFGLDYGISNWLSVGIGRSTYEKTFDGNLKFRLLRQKKDGVPFSVTYYGGMAVNSLQWAVPGRKNYFTSRLSYVNQLLISSRIGTELSLQLMPTHVHKNLVALKIDQNDIFAMGGGMSCKILKHLSVNAEYYYLLPGQAAKEAINSLSLGIDIETGGHIFQLFLTNSHPLFERGFITETQGKWNKGDIYFGFNLSRAFAIGKK